MQRIIYIDVDDTLIRSIGTKRIPLPQVIEEVKRLKKEGALLYLWSSGGGEYCKETAKDLGIEDYFEAFLPKPTQYIDDQPIHEWLYCKHIYPSQASEV